MTMRKMTIRISDDLRRELKNLCRQHGRSQSEVAREAVRRYVTLERFRTLRKKVVPLAEAQGILTDEDVFE